MAALSRIERRRRAQQKLGVGMQRGSEHARLGSDLDDAAKIHHGHAVLDVFHDAEIMRNRTGTTSRDRAGDRTRRFRIVACTDTSSAETGSSQMMISGLKASARAMPIRCLWPPENWWGNCRPGPASVRRAPSVPPPCARSAPSCRPAWMSSGARMMSRTRCRGLRDENGSGRRSASAADSPQASARRKLHRSPSRRSATATEPSPDHKPMQGQARGRFSTAGLPTSPRVSPLSSENVHSVDGLDRIRPAAANTPRTDGKMHLQILNRREAARERQQPALATSQHAAKCPASLILDPGGSLLEAPRRPRSGTAARKRSRRQSPIGGTVPGMSASRSPAALPATYRGRAPPSGRCV